MLLDVLSLILDFLIFSFLLVSDFSFLNMCTPHFILAYCFSHSLRRYYDLFIQRLFHKYDTRGWTRPKLGTSYFPGFIFNISEM